MRRISLFTAALVGGAIVAGAASAQGVAAGGGGVAAGGNGVAGGGMAVGGQAQYPAAAPMATSTGAPLTWVDPHQPPAASSAPAPTAPAASGAGVDTAATAPNSWADVTTAERPSPALHEPGPGSGHARRHAKTSSSRAAIARHERRSAPAS